MIRVIFRIWGIWAIWAALALTLASASALAKRKKTPTSAGQAQKKAKPEKLPEPGSKSTNEGAQGRTNATEDAAKAADSPQFGNGGPESVREPQLRRLLVEICHRMYRQGYIAAGDGNVSAKLDSTRILVTPTGFHKGFIEEDDLSIVDARGRLLRGRNQPSSEFLMHELAYAERPDVGAVVHAHPPMTVALALAGVSLAQCILSETCLALGPVLVAPYSTPTTDEVSQTLKPYMRQTNAIVMDRHGAITLGRDLHEAYNRLEALEHASKITHAARVLGPVAPLPPPEVNKLQALASKLGIPRAPDPCTLCNACSNGSGGPAGVGYDEAIVEAVMTKLRPPSA